MKEHTFDRSFEAPVPVIQPNFDDERTVLTARRVVPLEKIEAKVRHRRGWFLGAAFAIAMMLGAASALLASYLKLRNMPTSVTEISEVETPAAAPIAVAQPFTSSLLPAETAEDLGQLITPVPPKKPAVKRRAVVNHTLELTRPRVVREVSEQDELDRIREAVLFDAWQERRARRAARRERRNRVDHHDRDLSNLDEIFEGPRKRPY